jgi:hypothetical protein
LKAIRSLPERDQNAVLTYLLDRTLLREPASGGPLEHSRGFSSRPALLPSFTEPRIEIGPSASWSERDAVLILYRLAAGATAEQLAHLLGLEPALLQTVFSDLATRPRVSERLGRIFQSVAEGKSVAEIAEQLGVAESEITAELEPTQTLTSTVCAVLAARAALPAPPPCLVGAPGPLRTMPVRFPEPLYQRLKAWCEQHNFPMAVVVRGLVERFLDEHHPNA